MPKNSMDFGKQVKQEIKKVVEVSKYLWQKGWAERNGGNISLNITDIVSSINQDINVCKMIKVKSFPKEAAGMSFFVTGTGERFRELKHPDKTCCIIRFNEDATAYHVLWGGNLKKEVLPTSELITHVKIHIDKVKSSSPDRAIIHTHPTEIICFSLHPRYGRNEKRFNNAIWSTMPEVRLFVPKGVALCKYALPGSDALAELTVPALRRSNIAIWVKHGAIATGKDVLEAFDYIDVANKGCAIYLKCLSAYYDPKGLTSGELKDLTRTYSVI